jgi:hypothetical protein
LHTEPSKPNVIGRLTPAGVLEEDVANLGAETEAYPITPGPDGNMWFVTISKTGRQVDAIGTGAPAASQASPVVAGADQVGSELSCDGATWSTWAGQQPSTSLHGFDGYTWTLDGRAIAGQNAQSLLVSAADLGHQISCAVTATYQLLNVTVSAASPTVSIGAGPIIPPAEVPPRSALEIPHQSDTVTGKGALHVTLDCLNAPCSGTIRLTVKIKVTTGKGRYKRTKTVPMTIASASFSALSPGADKVSLKLISRGLSLLRGRGYKLDANVSVIYTTIGSAHASGAGTIELVGSRPKPKRK